MAAKIKKKSEKLYQVVGSVEHKLLEPLKEAAKLENRTPTRFIGLLVSEAFEQYQKQQGTHATKGNKDE